MSLEIILVSDHFTERDGIAQVLPLYLSNAGISGYRITETGESAFAEEQREDGTPYHESSILLVHGSCRQGYDNVGVVRRFMHKRPNLRFIITIDPHRCSEDDFSDAADYHFVKDNLSHAIDPAHPVSILQEAMSIFALMNNGEKFITYVQKYLALQQPLA